MSKTQNILTAFLGLLGVRHTVSFSEQTFNEHPHRYNLFGLSKMLSDYGVRSGGIEIPDKALQDGRFTVFYGFGSVI